MSDNVTLFPVIESEQITTKPGWRIRLSGREWIVAAFVLLILGAMTVRLLTFERFLPFLDYTDESNHYVIAQNWRGLDAYIVPRYVGMPPGYAAVNLVVQEIVDFLTPRDWILPAEHFYVTRLLAVLVGVITTLVIASVAWQLAGPIAGWFAGFVWALAPVIVEFNSLALPDPFLYLISAVALSTAIRAWYTESPGWLLGSVTAGILAVYFKGWPLHILLAWGITALVLIRRNPRRMLPWVGVQLVIGLIAAAYYLFGYGALNLSNREAVSFQTEGLQLMLSLDRNINNWWHAIYPIGQELFWGMLGLAAVAYVFSRRQGWRIVEIRWIAILAFYSFVGILMVSSFSNVWLGNEGKIRHVLPISVALFALWGAGLAQITWTLRKWAQEREFSRVQVFAPAMVSALILVILLPGYVQGNVKLVQRFSRTDIRLLLWQWTDLNIPPDGRIMTHSGSPLHLTWNREWSGYDGVKTFLWWHENADEIAQSTPQTYVDRGIVYFAVDDDDLGGGYNTPEMRAFIDQLTLVKTIPTGPDIAGKTVYFYRMHPPETVADRLYGDQIKLVGYKLDSSTVGPGESITFRPYWRTIRQPDANYQMFVHLYPADITELLAQYDGPPSVPNRPTLTWDDPEELYIGQDNTLTIPEDLEAGDYRMAVGLYDLTTFQRLLSEDGADFFTIPIRVAAAG